MNEFAVRLMVPDGKTSLNFNVQAGFVLKSKKGTTMGVDLYLTDCVERYDGFKRMSPKIIDPSTQIDYVLASHWHLDHFDIDAMPLLMSNRRTRLVCASDCRDHVKNLNIDETRVTYISLGDTVTCDDITVHAVFCDHGTSAPLAVGFVFDVDGYKIYLAGDTTLRLDKASEVAKYGPFDVMIAPINGAYGNLNEEECAELSVLIKPKLVIPCHYGMFATHGGNPGVFYEIMKKQYPKQDFLFLSMGEEIEI